MAEKTQDYKSHRQFVPLFHFVAFPILVVNVGVEAVRFYRYQSSYSGWVLILAIGLLLFATTVRTMVVKAQDRIIRLEERLRLASLMAPEQYAKIQDLTPRQLVALRFASDEEAPDLAQRTLTGEFKSPEEIKKAVKNWRADVHRV
jgi:hypothetical protein